MTRRSEARRVWNTAQYTITVSSTGTAAKLPIALDDAAASSVPPAMDRVRVVRMLAAVNLQSTGTGVVPTGAFAGFGLVLQNQADTSVSRPFSGTDADDPWVFWRAWPLPSGDYGASPLNAFFGNLDALWLDIPIRGGRGTNLRHDNGLYLVGQEIGLPAGVSLVINVMVRWLLEA